MLDDALMPGIGMISIMAYRLLICYYISSIRDRLVTLAREGTRLGPRMGVGGSAKDPMPLGRGRAEMMSTCSGHRRPPILCPINKA